MDNLIRVIARDGSVMCCAVDSTKIAGEAERIVTHASLTAKPFFLRRGYLVKKEQQVEKNGILLTNFVMELPKERADAG